MHITDCVGARNRGASIAATLRSRLACEYPDFWRHHRGPKLGWDDCADRARAGRRRPPLSLL